MLVSPARAYEAGYEKYYRDGKYAVIVGYIWLPEGARIVSVEGEASTNYGRSWAPVSGNYEQHIDRHGFKVPGLWKFGYMYKSNLIVYARTTLYYTTKGS